MEILDFLFGVSDVNKTRENKSFSKEHINTERLNEKNVKRLKQTPNSAFCKFEWFLEKCKELNVVPTKRQASKYRNKKGRVYNELRA